MNLHDHNAAVKFAGSVHEAAHAVLGVKLGHKLTKLTRHETRFAPGATDARVILAGGAAVAHFDKGRGRIDTEDDGDRRNLATLKLEPVDEARLRAETASLVNEHYQQIMDVAFALHRSETGELSPETVEELCR